VASGCLIRDRDRKFTAAFDGGADQRIPQSSVVSGKLLVSGYERVLAQDTPQPWAARNRRQAGDAWYYRSMTVVECWYDYQAGCEFA